MAANNFIRICQNLSATVTSYLPFSCLFQETPFRITLPPIYRLSKLSCLLRTLAVSLITIHRLAIIISKILKDVYGVRKPTVKAHLELAKRYMIDLSTWMEKASLLIHADLDILNANELYKLQRSELLLAYRHAHVLLLRNFMIDGSDVHSSAGVEDDETISNDELESQIDEVCGKLVEACLYICEIIEASEQESEKEKIEFTQSLRFRSAWVSNLFRPPLSYFLRNLLAPFRLT